MDVLDMKIFCEMGFDYHSPYSLGDRRPNPSAIAKNLGFDTRTVKSRIRKMEREGFIRYYQALPNFSLLGFRCSAYAFPILDPASKKEVVGKLKLLEEVTRIEENLNSVCIFPLYRTESDLEKKLALFRELTGTEPLKLYDMELPRVGLKLSTIDWSIIKSLKYDALKSFKKIAEELDISLPTVRKRLLRLTREKALFIVPIFSTEQVTNLIIYALVFLLDEAKGERAVREITEAFRENTYYRAVNPPRSVVLRLFATRMGEPEDNYMKAKAIEGVENIFLDFVKETHDRSGWVDRLIDYKLEETQTKFSIWLSEQSSSAFKHFIHSIGK